MNPSHVRLSVTILACLLVFVFFGRAGAEIPQLISYQGKVTDSGGTPVADGTYTMRFRIYDAVTGGIMEWDSGDRSIAVSDGVFNVILGESPQPTLNEPFNEDYWLLVTFDGVNQSPRQRLTSAGYAYMASGLVPGTLIEGSVTTGTNAAIKGVNTATTGATFGVYGRSHSTSGRGVHGYATATTGTAYGGIFESAATSGMGVYGKASATTGYTYGVYGWSRSTYGKGVYGEASAATGATYGGRFESASTSGKGVYGKASATTGDTYGVYGRSASTSGKGVYGWATATTGTTYGVYGVSKSTSGMGVYGNANATTGYNYGGWFESAGTDGRGVYGEASATTGYTYGGWFESASTDGRGVYCKATATTGFTYGVHGLSASTSGRGVNGHASATTGTTYGVYGSSASPSGKGVYGHASAATGTTYGVYGSSVSPSGKGVYGEAPHTGVYGKATATTGEHYGGSFVSYSSSGRGVHGQAPHTGVYGKATATTGTNYGVVGYSNSPSGYGGYFYGDVYVGGSINKAACSFLIDHPLDPENRLLRHNCMESPEHLVVYRGKARLDADGEAPVQMPEYFKALTKEQEASIHLTPVGKPFLTGADWNPGFRGFTVYGGPNRAVFWEVLAERDDPVIRRLARPVEEEKGPDNKFCDRGKLLDPTAYGYPESMGWDYEIFPPSNVHPVEEQEDWRPTGAGEPVKPDRSSEDVDAMEVGDAR